VESLREFWRQVKLLADFVAGNVFMRMATALFLVLMLTLFADEQLESGCRVAVCRWFGLWLVLASWAAAIVVQLMPRRWRRRNLPEAFLTLPTPLLAIAAMLVSSFGDPVAQGIITILLVFPLMAQIAIGIVETARRWRRMLLPQEARRRRHRRSS